MKILELTLTAPDLERQRGFYLGVLGLRESEPYWTGRLAVQVGGTRLNILPALEDWRGYYHFALDIPPTRFEAAARWLRERATVIASPEGETRFYHQGFNADSLYFRDPAGNILELIARRDFVAEQPEPPGLDPDRVFNSNEIISISEIGLATSSVSSAVAELVERIPGLAPYAGPPSDTFASVGDIHGLLILVINGRIWFPNTGVPAVFLPLEALLEIEQGNRLRQRYRLTAPPYPFSISPVQ